MDSFFHTYHIGGFVGTHEISRLLCELVTGQCTEWLRAAFVIRNSTPPDELEVAMNELSTSNDPRDRRLFAELQKSPIDEEALLYSESLVDQWDSAIRAAAYEKNWVCADLRSFAPVDPSSEDGFCVKVSDVIKWINDLKYPSILSEYLEVTLAISMEHHGESANSEAYVLFSEKDDGPAWIAIAKTKYLNFRQKYPGKTKHDIARLIRSEFEKEQTVFGRGGKIPSVDSILRRATQNQP